MSTGLLSQLERYYEWVDEGQDPIDPAEVASIIAGPIPDAHVPAPIAQSRGWTLAVVAAAFVLVVVGAAALLFDRDASAPSAAVPIGSSSGSELSWVRAPDIGGALGGPSEQSMSDVVELGSLLVAVGSAGSDAAVWVSGDGVAWSRVPHDESVLGGQGASMRMESVVAAGPGLVAVGEQVGPGGYPSAVVWTSTNGIDWSRVLDDPRPFGTPSSHMTDIAIGGPGLVAVGQHGKNAAVWTSVDGSEWTRVPHDEEVFGGRFYRSLRSVTEAGSGLVAVGERRVIDSFPPAIWTSTDGITWSRVPDNGDLFDGCRGGMSAVTTMGTELVAVGLRSSCEWSSWAVWRSPDGEAWTRISEGPELEIGHGQWMSDVTTGSYGLIAVGSEHIEERTSAAVWTSIDGTSWTRLLNAEPVFADGEMHAVIETRHGFVVVGHADTDAAVWIGTRD